MVLGIRHVRIVTHWLPLKPLLHVFLPFLCAPQNSNEKRKPKRVKWVYDHLGRLWMSFRCRSDVVSDVVQIAGGIQKFDILLCDRSKHSETSGRTNNKGKEGTTCNKYSCRMIGFQIKWNQICHLTS